MRRRLSDEVLVALWRTVLRNGRATLVSASRDQAEAVYSSALDAARRGTVGVQAARDPEDEAR